VRIGDNERIFLIRIYHFFLRSARRKDFQLLIQLEHTSSISVIILLKRIFFALLAACSAGSNEKRLLHDLLDSYNTLERPVVNESDPLQLSFGLTLMQIINVVSRFLCYNLYRTTK
jgi:hypothetical protein